MRFYLDTEFYESGARNPIHPISIGLVREDGTEYYAVYRDAPWDLIAQHDWLRENVLPHLPGEVVSNGQGRWGFLLDTTDPVVKLRAQIATDVEVFLSTGAELWAWYSAYDHVVLAQTFGTMAEMPKAIPFYTNDLKSFQHLVAPGYRFPDQGKGEHNALADARWVRVSHERLLRHIEGVNVWTPDLLRRPAEERLRVSVRVNVESCGYKDCDDVFMTKSALTQCWFPAPLVNGGVWTNEEIVHVHGAQITDWPKPEEL